MASGSSGHNAAVVELCFNGGVPPSNMPAEYAACIKDMQDSFSLLDGLIEDINEMTEEGNSLDGYGSSFSASAPASSFTLTVCVRSS